MNLRAPEQFHARFDTSKGIMLIEVHRDWSPHGADRFYNLVRAGYYDDARFFRVRAGRWAQFGIKGDPQVSNAWRERTIPDDPRQLSNTRGTVAFAFAVPNGRTTQVFINLADNSATHDAEPFVPFGKVVEGMDVADALNSEYGESAGGGIRGGKQSPLFEQGNAWLLSHFPRLDFIIRATVIEGARTALSANSRARDATRGQGESVSKPRRDELHESPIFHNGRKVRDSCNSSLRPRGFEKDRAVRAPRPAFGLAIVRLAGVYSARFPFHIAVTSTNNQKSKYEKNHSAMHHGLAGEFAVRGGFQPQG